MRKRVLHNTLYIIHRLELSGAFTIAQYLAQSQLNILALLVVACSIAGSLTIIFGAVFDLYNVLMFAFFNQHDNIIVKITGFILYLAKTITLLSGALLLYGAQRLFHLPIMIVFRQRCSTIPRGCLSALLKIFKMISVVTSTIIQAIIVIPITNLMKGPKTIRNLIKKRIESEQKAHRERNQSYSGPLITKYYNRHIVLLQLPIVLFLETIKGIYMLVVDSLILLPLEYLMDTSYTWTNKLILIPFKNQIYSPLYEFIKQTRKSTQAATNHYISLFIAGITTCFALYVSYWVIQQSEYPSSNSNVVYFPHDGNILKNLLHNFLQNITLSGWIGLFIIDMFKNEHQSTFLKAIIDSILKNKRMYKVIYYSSIIILSPFFLLESYINLNRKMECYRNRINTPNSTIPPTDPMAQEYIESTMSKTLSPITEIVRKYVSFHIEVVRFFKRCVEATFLHPLRVAYRQVDIVMNHLRFFNRGRDIFHLQESRYNPHFIAIRREVMRLPALLSNEAIGIIQDYTDTTAQIKQPCTGDILGKDENKLVLDSLRAKHELTCPISLDLIEEPVMSSTGIIFEKASILAYLNRCKSEKITCPVTKYPLKFIVPANRYRGELISSLNNSR